MSSIILLSGILNIFIGLVVWLRDPQKKLNFGFAIFSWATALSISVDYLFRFIPTLFVLRSSYAAAALVPLSALVWIIEICQINFRSLQLWKKIIIILPTPIFAILPFIDGLVIKKINYLTVLGYKGELGPLFLLYSLYFVLYETSFIYLLYRNQRKAQGALKLQSRFILFGISSYGIVAVTFSLILPNYFGIFDFTLLDAPSLILFVGFTGYAILRLHLFNIKILSTELLVFTLTTFIFFYIFIIDNKPNKIIGLLMMLLVFITDIFIIKNLLTIIKQKIDIENLVSSLQTLNLTLEDKVNEQTQEIRRAYDLEKFARRELEKLNDTKDQFIMITQHNIRTPILNIDSNINAAVGILNAESAFLSDIVFENIRTKIYNFLNNASESVFRVKSIIDDFLNITSIKSNSQILKISEINIYKIIEKAINELSVNIEKMNINVIFKNNNDAIYAKIDSNKIYEVMIIIIENAIKYNMPGGNIKIECMKDNEIIQIDISNTGVGMSKEDKENIFNKVFYRSKKAKMTHPVGMGVGLSVAKAIIKAHHGDIEIDSEGENKGAKVSIKLPINISKVF